MGQEQNSAVDDAVFSRESPEILALFCSFYCFAGNASIGKQGCASA
jgi:hypothetical protein